MTPRSSARGSTPRRGRRGHALGAAGLAILLGAAGWGPAPDLVAQVLEGGVAVEPGIRVVGRFDPATGHTTYRVAEPLAGREVLALQRALLRAGASPGTPDGRLGPATRAALRRFQAEQGLRPCGCPSYETVLALGLEPRVGRVVVGSGREADAGTGVRVIRPSGIVAGTGGVGAPGAEGVAAGEPGREGRSEVAPGEPPAGHWLPWIVPGVLVVPGPTLAPPPRNAGTPAPPRPPRGVSPPGIRPSPPPRVTPRPVPRPPPPSAPSGRAS